MTIKMVRKGKSLDSLEKSLERTITNELKAIVSMAHSEVLAHTPVNTGTLAANTNFSLNQPDRSFGILENEVKGKRFGKFDQRMSGPRTYTE